MNNLSLDDFQLFARIAATQSLSDVARERDIAASQVSRGLRRIETECGLRLAHRTTHGLSLTDDGEVFLEYAQRILTEQQLLRDHIGQRSQAATGTVHIGVGQLLAEHVLIPRLGGLRTLHPGLTITLHIDDRLVSMAEEGIDIAVRAGVPPAETLVARLLGTHGRALYAAPGYLRKHGVPRVPADLGAHTLIGNTVSPSHNRWDFLVDGVSTALETQAQIRVNSSSAVLSLALAGAGIARINDVLGRGLVAQGRLKSVLARHVVPGEHHIHAVILAERHRAPKIRATMDYLQTCFSEFRALPGK
ncbi:MAG: LysR family transcriptional regulator [Polaromonas sp.]|uniref:LysR family transcriptional regulator n=1 Tax=Polaromonas sp. TaxID=1869339 RepID=UPI0032674867